MVRVFEVTLGVEVETLRYSPSNIHLKERSAPLAPTVKLASSPSRTKASIGCIAMKGASSSNRQGGDDNEGWADLKGEYEGGSYLRDSPI